MGDNYIIECESEEQLNKQEEFFDLLNQYYLKISTTSIDNLLFQCYNTKLLDNIEYIGNISINDLQIKTLYNYYNINEFFNLFVESIKKEKFKIEENKNILILNIEINDYNKNNIIIQINLRINNNKHNNGILLGILSNEIIKIRNQNKEIENIQKEQEAFKNKLEVEIKKLSN